MSLRLVCACGKPIVGNTGDELYAAAAAHIDQHHRELLRSGGRVAQLDDEAEAVAPYLQQDEKRGRHVSHRPEPLEATDRDMRHRGT